jgi:predicted metalloprotease
MGEITNRKLPRVLLSLIAALVLAFAIGYSGVSGFGGEPIGVDKASAYPGTYVEDIAYTAGVDANAFWRDYFAYYDDPWEDVQNIVSVCNHPLGAHYQPGNMNIYYDTCWDNNNYGDGAIAAIMAHEVGHHVQNMAGIYRQGHITVHTELQADCLAGVYMADAWYRGMLDGNDLEQAEAWMYNHGDNLDWENVDHHGTGEERLAWFDHGWTTEDPGKCAAALNLP